MPVPAAVLGDAAPWLGLAAFTVGALWVDLHYFARGRDPSFGEAVRWSIGWLVVGLAAAVVPAVLEDTDAAVTYVTVYLIERSLSLDNLFVFLLLMTYFAVRPVDRGRLIFWGIAAALVLRGLAILGGVALIERFSWALYVLGGLLVLLAWRILRSGDEEVDPDRNLIVRGVRRVFPVAPGAHDAHWFVSIDGRRHVTTLFLCLAAIVAADLAFAVDSIPAAFAITRDSVLIWMGNVFALLGLRALFVLVEGLIRRFRYLDQTIAGVLALVGVKLLLEDVVHVGPGLSLAIVAGAFAVGIAASLIGDARDPGARERRERAEDGGLAEAAERGREREREPSDVAG
jgi:tellurite resistance protein TerC